MVGKNKRCRRVDYEIYGKMGFHPHLSLYLLYLFRAREKRKKQILVLDFVSKNRIIGTLKS